MKKNRIKSIVIICFAVLFMGAAKQAYAASGCGFDTAGDYTCRTEGTNLRTPNDPGPANIPGYSGPGQDGRELPPRPPYTPGDLTPGLIVPYIPEFPIFIYPILIPLPGVPVVPIVICNPVTPEPVDPGDPTPVEPGPTGSCADYLARIRQRESSNNYQARRPGSQYWGAYQMGNDARADAGCSRYSSDEFLNSPGIQDQCIQNYYRRVWGYIENAGLTRYIGQRVNGICITPAALLGGYHLKGIGTASNPCLRQFLEGSIDGTDALGTRISEYMSMMGNYDSSCWTGRQNEPCSG